MSKRQKTQQTPAVNVTTNTPEPTRSKFTNQPVAEVVNQDLLFGKKNYYFMLGGLGLIFLGFILMSGGSMPSPDVWDESLIYSPMRITIAPLLILAGFGLEVVAIFSKKD
jgi:hypothetical protein